MTTSVVVDFPSIPWIAVEEGGASGRMKRHTLKDGGVVRILEMSPRWSERDWCKRPHTGYVLKGRLRLDFRSEKPVVVKRGQGFSIPEGLAHKATCKTHTTMFIVG